MSILARTAIRPPAGVGLAGLAALAAVTVLTACGTTPAPKDTSPAGHQRTVRLACATTVHGVVGGPASLTPAWLPPSYHLQPGSVRASALPESTYVKETGQPDPPRIMLNSSYQAGPVTGSDGGAGKGTPVRIDGHNGLIESGPPAPQLVGIYWKPSRGFLVSVVGANVARSVVLKVALHLSFAAPRVIALPVTPGPIVTRQAAITAAERAVGGTRRAAAVKLSSWTEVDALAGLARQNLTAPPGLAATPWRPVWAVLLAGSPAPPTVVVVAAGSGRVELTVPEHGTWFGALTDRDGPAGQCPGGSSAQLPFGVLTRDEQEYAGGARPSTAGAKSYVRHVRYVLSTVPAVNRADPSLYGGCIQQDCSISQLVWVTIATVRADPGKTVACLPDDVSVPPGNRARQVTEYYSVSVPGSFGIGCGPTPAWVTRLADLAPPAPPTGEGS